MSAPSAAIADEGAPRAPSATFHARVAGVGLITTVVVLVAACLTFTLQHWAVARTQAHRFHEGLTEVAAAVAAPYMGAGQQPALQRAMASVKANRDVLAGRITDAGGRELAGFRSAKPKSGPGEVIVRPILEDGRKLGELSLTLEQPPLAPMLPQFIALTFVLLFGGVGV
ncbi:MAG TPA: hybrid sensor histidine kinase/response regulator, partial [Phenylobacterium sp.]|nr:hybrid sensor histidine kinase/response regulator [Phenylobacterium sp.]